jgi:diaminobutyrate-2-oxoglutarate transaminase
VGAKAALEYREAVGLEDKVEKNNRLITDFIKSRLIPMDSRLAHRGIGMIHGIDFEKIGDINEPTISGRVARECFENGLIIERAGRK